MNTLRVLCLATLIALLSACPENVGAPDAGPDTGADAGGSQGEPDAGERTKDAGTADDAGAVLDAGAPVDPPVDAGAPVDAGGTIDAGGPRSLTVVTFNTGTGISNGVDDDGDDWTSVEQAIGDEHYGNGLAWLDAIEAARVFFANLQPDIVAFQEIFHPEECAGIASELHTGFICETWTAGDPTVAQVVLGAGYQIACNLEKTDKCAAVKRSFGAFRGCTEDLCLDHLDGVEIDTCGNGSRNGRGVIDLVGGGELTLVTVHGTSGILQSDQDCRVAQIEQVFVDLDGAPAASGARNIIMGDFNTDPGRAAALDDSADRWTDFVGEGEDFHFVTDVGFGTPATYAGTVNIDHVVSDVFTGSCRAAGVTAALPPVMPTVHFDHTPIICDLTAP